MNIYPTPKYLLGALVTDEAPVRLSLKIAQGYAAALADLNAEERHEWVQTTAKTCLSRGWRHAALALLTIASPTCKHIYEGRAEEYLHDHEEVQHG